MMTKDDAVKWLDNLTQDIGQMRHQDLWPYAQALSYISQMIDEMPDIVRCKDCKYRAKGLPYCAYFGETEFCSRGERRENR